MTDYIQSTMVSWYKDIGTRASPIYISSDELRRWEEARCLSVRETDGRSISVPQLLRGSENVGTVNAVSYTHLTLPTILLV